MKMVDLPPIVTSGRGRNFPLGRPDYARDKFNHKAKKINYVRYNLFGK